MKYNPKKTDFDNLIDFVGELLHNLQQDENNAGAGKTENTTARAAVQQLHIGLRNATFTKVAATPRLAAFLQAHSSDNSPVIETLTAAKKDIAPAISKDENDERLRNELKRLRDGAIEVPKPLAAVETPQSEPQVAETPQDKPQVVETPQGAKLLTEIHNADIDSVDKVTKSIKSASVATLKEVLAAINSEAPILAKDKTEKSELQSELIDFLNVWVTEKEGAKKPTDSEPTNSEPTDN